MTKPWKLVPLAFIAAIGVILFATSAVNANVTNATDSCDPVI